MKCASVATSIRVASNHAGFVRRIALSMLTLAFAMLLAGMLVPSKAVAQTDPAPPAPSSLIVKLVAGLTLDQQAAVIARNGGVETSTVPALRLHVVEVGADQVDQALAKYQADSQVARVEVNSVRQSNTVPSDPLYSRQWALPRIGWDVAFGSTNPTSDVVVAVLDTGIEGSHPDLAGNIIAGTSILDGSNGLSDPSGHGTMVAGTVAARTNTNPPAGIAGVAYAGVRLMPVTVLNADGVGQDSDIITGVVWAVDHGADVILMAFSNPGFSESLQEAIDYAWSSNIVLVGATGNDGVDAPTFPAGDRGVIGVSATDSNDQLAPFSNYGASVFLAAPGTDILTTDVGGAYIAINGTSSSAAIVAGAAAQMMAIDPTLANGVVVGRLARTADPAGTQNETGNGRINLARALLDIGTEFIQPAGSAPVGDGGPFVGPYRAAATSLNSISVGLQTGTVTAGNAGSVTFAVTVTGTGNGNLSTISVTAGLPTGATFTPTKFPASGNCNASQSACNFSLTISTTTITPAGTFPFTLSVTADGGNTRTAGGTLTVGKANQTITVTTPAPVSAAYNSTFIVAATASSGLGVAITATGGCSGTGSNSASITMTSPTNACIVHYNQAGNSSYNAATEVISTTSATKANQTISFGPLTDRTYGDPSLALSATANSTLAVTFSSQTMATCTVSGSTVTIVAAGLCTIRASQAGDANFNAASDVDRSFTINKAAATLVLGNLAQTYDGTPKAATVATSPLGLAVVSVTYDGGALAPTNAGSYAVVASLTNANYTAPNAAGTLVINKAPATLTLGGLLQTYDGTPRLVTVTTNPAALAGVSITYDGSASAPVGAGSYGVVASLSNANYASANAIGTLQVNQAALVITAKDRTKTFGDVVVFAGNEFVASGLVNGDSVASVTLTSSGAAATATAAGSPYAITPSVAVGTGLANYAIGYHDGSLSVAKYAFSVCEANDHCAGGSDENSAGIGGRLTISPIVPFKGSGSADVELSPATIGDLDALGSPGRDANDIPLPPRFKVWIAPSTDPAHPIFFGAGSATKIPLDGIDTWTTTIVATLDASIVPGSYTAYVYGDDAESLTNNPALKDDGYAKPDTGNFEYPTLTASLTVVKAEQTITFAPLADKTYGDPDFDVNASASSGLNVSFAASGACTIDGTTVHIAGAGDCAITASQSGDSNYNAATDVKRTFAIGKANATIDVIPYEVTFDGAPHTASGTAKGVFNEPLSGLDLSGTTHTSAGDYATDPWTFTDVTGNYQNATGTVHDRINKANATISVTPYSVTYDGAAHTATGTATGVGGVDLGASLNLSGTTHTNAGIYTADPWTFAGGANYNDASGTVDDRINKANATINVMPYTVTYDGAAHTATATATGVGGVNLAAGLNVSATTHTNAGDYATDAWTFTDATGNYNNASGTVHDLIYRKTASVTPNAATKTYGDGDPPFSGVLSGFLAGDGVTATYGRSPGETVTSGPYAISAMLSPAAVLSNYAVTYNTGVFTITQRALTVTADSKTKIAGGVNPALSGVIVGIQFGDGIIASYTTTAVTLSAPGSYPITPAVNPDAKLGNYMVTTVAGTLIVSANAFPVLGTITGPVAPTPLGTPIQISVPFTDLDVPESQPYTATIDWGDLATSTTQFSSSGTITGSHTYVAGGVYVVSVTIKQNNFEDHQDTKTVEGYVVVYDPSAGFVTGGGWINSPPGAFYANPSLTGKANFGFVSKYQKGANVPTGNTEFQFQAGNFSFKSTSYEWLVISGGFKAQYKGTGTVNGKGSYGFMLTAIDGGAKGGGSPDTFRLKVWDANGSVYDNQLNAPDISDPTTAVSGGSIVIHK